MYCYLLISTSTNVTYIGITNNLERRLKQHNGLLIGGAKATRRFKDWIYYKVIELSNKNDALKFEYQWKHTKSGLNNKLIKLDEIIKKYDAKIVL